MDFFSAPLRFVSVFSAQHKCWKFGDSKIHALLWTWDRALARSGRKSPHILYAGACAFVLRYPDLDNARDCSASRVIIACTSSAWIQSLTIYRLSKQCRHRPLYRKCSSRRTRVWNCVIHIGHIVQSASTTYCEGCIHLCTLNMCKFNCCMVCALKQQIVQEKGCGQIICETSDLYIIWSGT